MAELPEFHGMLSQTYLHSRDHDYLISKSTEGSWEFTELGLNVQQQFEDVRYGVQVVVRDFGDEGDFLPVLDWAYLDYSPSDAFGVKLGKVKLPMGLYNEYRDVDRSKTEILFPQIFNSEDYRAAAHAYLGVGFHGSLTFFKENLLDYHLWYGTNRIRDDFFLVARTRLQMERLTGLSQGSMVQSSDLLAGAQLVYNIDAYGVRCGFVHIHYKGGFNVRFNDLAQEAGEAQILDRQNSIDLDITWNILSLEWRGGPFWISSEMSFRDNHYCYGELFFSNYLNHIGLDDSIADGDYSRSWYITGRYQGTESTSLFCSFGRRNIDLHHNTTINASGETVVRPDELLELSTGFRIDLTNHLTLKFQATRYWGYYGTLDVTENDDEDWMLYLGRLSITF